MTKPKKLLVLTSASGAGHDTHAQATVAWCHEFYGDQVHVRVEHALEDSHPFYRKAVGFYNFIQRRMPWFHHIYYNLIEMLELLNPGTVSLGSEYYVQLLQEYQPDAILSVHDCLNRGYFELAKKTLGPQVRCATYCTEFTGGYGFSRNWVNPRGDYWFGRTKEAMTESPARRLRVGQAILGGHWAPTAFYKIPMSSEERADYIRQKLNLDPNRFILLLSTGGAGAQNHFTILQDLKPLGDRIQVVALCGTNQEAKEKLTQWVEQNVTFPVRLLGFTNEMPSLLQVCSTVVARAGATTAGESLLCRCPVIFNALGGIMPQEMPTWRYFQKYKVGAVAYRSQSIVQILKSWLQQEEILIGMRTRLDALRDATTPEAALRHLLND